MVIKSSEITKSLRELIEKEHQSVNRIIGTDIGERDFDKIMSQLREDKLLLPDDCIQSIVRETLERDFLNHLALAPYKRSVLSVKEQGWLRVTRLPISPLEDKKYALFPRWQNSISTLHALNQKLCYILMRVDGETRLYLGAVPNLRGVGSTTVQNRLRQAVFCQMPGISLKDIDKSELNSLNTLRCCGVVTGLPSIRKINAYGEYQTMDQIAAGLRDIEGEQDFAVLIIASPISDSSIVDTLRSLENLGSEIHALTQYSKTEETNSEITVSISYSDGISTGISVGTDVGMGVSLGELIKADVRFNTEINIGSSFSTTNEKGGSVGHSDSISQSYISKSAMYCEELIDKHIDRMKAGRSLGFWKVGIYVLASKKSNVETVMGMLRAVYSGDDTYVEPIRTKVLPEDSGAYDIIRSFDILPFKCPPVSSVLGNTFEDFATPMTTEELSIATSLPRRDVPGLRLIRNSSRFSENSPFIRSRENGGIPVELGKILDAGGDTAQKYFVDLNQLVRHALIAGINGSGKTNTCLGLLEKTIRERIPFLVIEPSKDEYLNWALAYNQAHKDDQILIYAPGTFNDDRILKLALNPFQVAVAGDAYVNMLEHLDRFKSVLMNCMPMYDVLPLIVEETLFKTVQDQMDVKTRSLVKDNNPLNGPFLDDSKLEYPLISSMQVAADSIIDGRGYSNEVKANIRSAVRTKINSFMMGWKKSLFNVPRSTDYEVIFEKKNVVINLSHLTDDKDKAFVMSILLIALWEYRESKYVYDIEYKKEVNLNNLKHLTLIEEAHRILLNIQENGNIGNNSQATVSKMFSNMLSEIRAYGEGCLIVDNAPTRLITDAIKNTNLKIAHRLTFSDDIKAMSTSMMLKQDQEAVIGTLQVGQAIVCSDFDDEASWIEMDPVEKH